ncbi:MAG: hypothetical protein J6U35_03810 [Clostridia bacterium]|nr:hypothetical protein [Clostridia bacterium]
MAKDKKEDGLDTETSFADMNVEGFSWYDPSAKKNKPRKEKTRITRKEYRAMVKGAYLAMLPMIIAIVSGFLLVFLIAYLWLKP